MGSNSRENSLILTKIASLEAETDRAADQILDATGVAEPQQARTFSHQCSSGVRLSFVLSEILHAKSLFGMHCLAGVLQLDKAVVSSGFRELSGPQGMPMDVKVLW